MSLSLGLGLGLTMQRSAATDALLKLFDAQQPIGDLPTSCRLWKRRVTGSNEFSVFTPMDEAGAYINWYQTDRLDASNTPRHIAAVEISKSGATYDQLDHPKFPSSAANLGTHGLIGTGNLEYASLIRKPTDAAGTQALAGGTHGNESAPSSLVVTLDGATIDYASAAADAVWDFSVGTIVTEHSLNFANGDKWADITFTRKFSRGGYEVEIVRTTAADAVVYDDYGPMLSVFNPTNASASSTGGIEDMNIRDVGARTFAQRDNSQTTINTTHAELIAFNDVYAALMRVTNVSALRSHFSAHSADAAIDFGLVQDRTDGALKYYSRLSQSNTTAPVTLLAGDVLTYKASYRIAKGESGWTSVFQE